MIRTIGNYEPPLSIQGSSAFDLDELWPGVEGYALEYRGDIYIPVVIAKHEGNGDVGRFLDACSIRCVFPSVVNEIFRGMLERRGFAPYEEPATFPFEGSISTVWRRIPPKQEPGAQ